MTCTKTTFVRKTIFDFEEENLEQVSHKMTSIIEKDGGSPLSSPVRTFNRILPKIVLEGTTEEIGRKHGSVFKHRIRETWGWYRKLFLAAGAKSEEELMAMGNKYAAIIPRHTPL